jgi:hypothetical protein
VKGKRKKVKGKRQMKSPTTFAFYLLPFSLFISGCSTHPLVDTLDFFKPGKLGPVTVQPYGGVNIPQGPLVPGAPVVPPIGIPVPVQPTAVVPPPAPLPGGPPPGGGIPAFPPLPPNPPKS